MRADVTAAGERLSENRRVVDDVTPDEEVCRRLVLLLQESVERRRVFERLSSEGEMRSGVARVQT